MKCGGWRTRSHALGAIAKGMLMLKDCEVRGDQPAVLEPTGDSTHIGGHTDAPSVASGNPIEP